MAERYNPGDVGFRPATVKTWDPTLVREQRVLVPVHLDVLLVRTEGGEWADCTMKKPSDQTKRSIDLLPDPFADLTTARPRGAYLHWAAPDALATLEPAGSTLTHPALPDRWLVVRIAGPDRTVTAWVLDSRAGTWTPLDAWTPSPPSGPPVTVLGIGDAGWAAYYDNVTSRFAFYDALGDIRGPIAYLVCGWYADPSLDPLAGPPRSGISFDARLGELAWSLDGADLRSAHDVARSRIEKATKAGLETPHAALDANDEVVFRNQAAPLTASGKPVDGSYSTSEQHTPRASLFHGAVVDLSWPNADPASPEVGGPPDASGIAVAVAATPIQALSTLIARVAGSEEAEWLNAFALGALDEIRRPNGTSLLDDRLHDAAFVSRSDGTETVAREPSAMPERPPPAPPPKKTKGGWTGVKKADFYAVHETSVSRPTTPELAEITLPNPRLYLPADPVIAIHGAARSFKHGGDGRFGDGSLLCRVTGSTIGGIACKGASFVRGTDVARPLDHGGIPPECEDLLEELVVLDPGSAGAIARVATRSAPSTSVDVLTRTIATEQTAWWALRSPRTDARAILAHSALSGTLPSPTAIRPPQKPWVPLHLDWEIEYVASPVRDWSSGEIELGAPPVPDRPGEIFRGRSLLSPGIATAVATALDKYLGTESAAGGDVLKNADRSDALEDVAARLRNLDVLAGPLEQFHTKLRRGIRPDDPSVAAPAGFVAVRSGFLRLRRLRLVDAFGQVLYLAGSSAQGPVDAGRVATSGEPVGPGVLALPPRFTAPTRVSFRFRDAERAADATDDRTPVCGWLMPNHIDGGVEIFDATGTALGELWLDPDAGTIWEPAPGTPAAFGAAPSTAIANPVLCGIAQALYDLGPSDKAAGRPSALAEMLRVIDATRWTIDPFGHAGEEHLSLLVGHPVAVVRASLSIEVRERVTGTDVPVTAIPVRLGSLTHWEDGLFGFFVAGDFRTLHCATAAAALARPSPADGFLGPIASVPGYADTFSTDVSSGSPATPVVHPYVDSSGVLWVPPNVEVDLVLLLEPHTVVHATPCIVPRKQLGVRRAWMAPALAKMAPTFRFGPVLHDPTRIRMPIPSDIGGAWSWTHRADVDKWTEDAVIHAAQDALLPPDPAVATEGWLRLTPQEKR